MELESHHVGVSHRAAQRRLDLLLPAHGRPHNSGAITAAKQRKRDTNRHDSVFLRDVAQPDQAPKWARPSQDGEQPIMHGARNQPLNFDQAMDMWRRKRKNKQRDKGQKRYTPCKKKKRFGSVDSTTATTTATSTSKS